MNRTGYTGNSSSTAYAYYRQQQTDMIRYREVSAEVEKEIQQEEKEFNDIYYLLT